MNSLLIFPIYFGGKAMGGKIGQDEEHFQEPASLEEAVSRRDQLLNDIGFIDVQLADRDRHNPDTSERLTEIEYHQWRRRALYARQSKVAEARLLKGWIRKRELAERAASVQINLEDPHSLIRAAMLVLVAMQNEAVEFTKDEQLVVAALKEYCLRHGILERGMANG